MRKTGRNSVSDGSTLHFKSPTFTSFYRQTEEVNCHFKVFAFGVGVCFHILATSWLLESLIVLYPHFSLSLSSLKHSVCPLYSQISSLQTSEGADEAECGEGGEVRDEERDGGGPAGDHLQDKMLLR